MSQYDVAVIGGGAAGLSAALVLSRARRNVVVVDAGSPRNAPAAHMHGYLSRDGLPPGELLAVGRDEVKSYGGEIVDGTATDLMPDGRRVLGPARRRAADLGPAAAGHDRPARRAAGHPRDCATGGPAMSCTAPTATATKYATAGSASSAAAPGAVRYAQIVRQWTHDLVYFTPPDIPHHRRAVPSWSPAPSASSKAPSTSWSSTTTSCAASRCATAASCPATRCSCRPASSRTTSLLVGLGCRRRRRRLGHHGHHRPHQRPRRLGRRQHRRPARPGHHRRRRRLGRRHRPQRRPRRGRRPRCRPRLSPGLRAP